MDARPLPGKSLQKLPRQARSVQTVHAVLDAARRILLREGAASFNTNRIATVAGISPGSLYEYFTNREAILAAVVERRVMEAQEELRRAWGNRADLADGARLRIAVDAWLARLEVDAALITEVFGLARLLPERGIATMLGASLVDAHLSEEERPDSTPHQRVGQEAVFIAENVLAFVILRWLAERPAHVPRGSLVDQVCWLLQRMVNRSTGWRLPRHRDG